MWNLINSRQDLGGQYKNYFSWIANLGVVPLFLLAFFLLDPAPFFLAALLFVVTLVRETIKPPLIVNYSLCLNYKMRFLPVLGKSVKTLFVLAATFLCFFNLRAFADELSHDVILSRGQSMELKLPRMVKFNIGNKDVLNYKFNEKTKTLLLRGTKIGHSEVLVWNSDNQKEAYEVSIISKVQEEKIFHLSASLNAQGVSSKIIGTHIEISGEIQTNENYINLKKLILTNKETILDFTTISSSVKNRIIAEIYQRFFNEYKDSINCEVLRSDIICTYSEIDPPPASLIKYYVEKYTIIFTSERAQHNQQNYSMRIKLIQLEQLDGEELSLGLEQINGTLGELLSSPIMTIIKKNQVLLAKTNVSISTLAEPELVLRPEITGEIQIGSEIPFSVSKNSTSWKFAGLKIKIYLENIGDQLKINFETELTQPSLTSANQTSVSGTIGKSSVIVTLNKPLKIFQVSLRTKGNHSDSMPYLGAIPILGELFKSKSKQDNFKTITGIIEVVANE